MKTYKITVTQEYADDFEEVVHVSNFKEAWKMALEQVVEPDDVKIHIKKVDMVDCQICGNECEEMEALNNSKYSTSNFKLCCDGCESRISREHDNYIHGY
jgi:hypothetical protein